MYVPYWWYVKGRVMCTLQYLHIVDTPEIRHLMLLLRNSLTDIDIIHRTTLRSLIAHSWKVRFEDLQIELRVCY